MVRAVTFVAAAALIASVACAGEIDASKARLLDGLLPSTLFSHKAKAAYAEKSLSKFIEAHEQLLRGRMLAATTVCGCK